MMNDGGGGDSLVDDQIRQVFDNIHGCHVDHYLGVGSMLGGVQNIDVSFVKSCQSNVTKFCFK